MKKNLFFFAVSLIVAFASIGIYASTFKMEPIEAPHIIYTMVKYPSPPKDFSSKLLSYIEKVSNKAGVPYLLVLRVIEVESNWDKTAVNINSNGTRDNGLMQLNSKYVKDFIWEYGAKGVKYQPNTHAYDNVYIGIKHLKALYNETGSWKKAVQAYNAGLTRTLKNTLPDRTIRYADSIVPVEGWWDSPENVIFF